ncbi:hypothetical protein BDV23DRAFT_11457 [Aspergillus alliaceus]|uniref:Uncharacterized protein n=1 Tax=Petromyces alliaceus TaxID=209559 RepID=A0A5N7CJL2_PETAA|nr:hypothetical protein BDV23DRAFT_11457 [Aspergillus alliaceus]
MIQCFGAGIFSCLWFSYCCLQSLVVFPTFLLALFTLLSRRNFRLWRCLQGVIHCGFCIGSYKMQPFLSVHFLYSPGGHAFFDESRIPEELLFSIVQ